MKKLNLTLTKKQLNLLFHAVADAAMAERELDPDSKATSDLEKLEGIISDHIDSKGGAA